MKIPEIPFNSALKIQNKIRSVRSAAAANVPRRGAFASDGVLGKFSLERRGGKSLSPRRVCLGWKSGHGLVLSAAAARTPRRGALVLGEPC